MANKIKSCNYCKTNLEDFSRSHSMNHIRWCELNPKRAKAKKKCCVICNSEHLRRSSYCSVSCVKIKMEATKEERGLKISNGMKKFISENQNKHNWKNKNKFKSIPCEKVKEFLKDNNIKFVEEWRPLKNRFFSIDIAFPDIKFGIEINGNQHYNSDGTLKEYYQNRHDLIVNSGWKLLELHYTTCFNIGLIKDIINTEEQPDYSEYFEKRYTKTKKSQNNIRGLKVRMQTDLKWEPYKSIILHSNIDFSKFGWVSKVASVLNIRHQRVSSWMRRYLSDFYEHHCYKRK